MLLRKTGLVADRKDGLRVYYSVRDPSVYAVLDVAPSPPTSITVPATSTGTHIVSWGAATGTVTRYELQQDTNSGFTAPTLAYSGTALSSSVTVTQDGTYYYRVRACNGTACSNYATGGNGVTATVPLLAPSTPPSISVPTSSSTGTYTISWGVSTGTVTEYVLYERTTVGGFGTIYPVYRGTALSTTLIGKANGTYSYQIQACNGIACSALLAGSNSIVVTLAGTPSIPSSITVPVTSTTTSYTISWGPSTGTVTHYELQEGTDQNFICYMRDCPLGMMCMQVCGTSPNVYSGTALSATITRGFITNRTYYYRVRACNSIGCSDYRVGGNSVLVQLPPPPAIPAKPSAIFAPAYGSAYTPYTVSWERAEGVVSHYELQEMNVWSLSVDQMHQYNSEWTDVYSGLGSGDDPSVEIASKEISAGYFAYRVRACNSSGCSAYKETEHNVIVTNPQ
jgi:hypothetical protein